VRRRLDLVKHGETPPGLGETPPGLNETPPGLNETPPGLNETPCCGGGQLIN